MKRRRRDERGFVMLLVFLMAALIAISLYNEIPRVSFESQRRARQRRLETRGALVVTGEQVRDAERERVHRARRRHPGRRVARTPEILDRGQQSGVGDAERHAGRNRTRSPGCRVAGGSRPASKSSSSVRPMSRHPPGVARG